MLHFNYEVNWYSSSNSLTIINFDVLLSDSECLVLKMLLVLCAIMTNLDKTILHLSSGWIMFSVVDMKMLWTSATLVAGELLTVSLIITPELFVKMVSYCYQNNWQSINR